MGPPTPGRTGTNSYRSFNNDTTNLPQGVLIGVAEVLVRAVSKTNIVSATAGANRLYSTGIGVGSATSNSAILMGGRCNDPTPSSPVQIWGEYVAYQSIGYQLIYPVEISISGANCTVWGVNSNNTAVRSAAQILYEG